MHIQGLKFCICKTMKWLQELPCFQQKLIISFLISLYHLPWIAWVDYWMLLQWEGENLCLWLIEVPVDQQTDSWGSWKWRAHKSLQWKLCHQGNQALGWKFENKMMWTSLPVTTKFFLGICRAHFPQLRQILPWCVGFASMLLCDLYHICWAQIQEIFES